MVRLEFQIQVSAPFEKVWEFFGRFENVPKWDLNTKGCQILRKNQHEIGSIYNILTVFNGKQSTVSYETVKYDVTQNRGYIALDGKNDQITGYDQIICERQGDLTRIIYRANICLRGVLWLFTPLIKSDLNTITEQAKQGCLKKATELFGKARPIK